jgi:hypothetical protein
VKAPCVVGVPERSPVAALIVTPVGRVPEAIVHTYGDVPPVAARTEVYAVPTVPEGGAPMIEMAPVATVPITILFDAETVSGTSLESVTEKVTGKVPSAVGVPEMTPVEALNVKPAGRVPAVMLSVRGGVPPDVVNVAE